MHAPPRPGDRLRFGLFQLDSTRSELLREGHRVRLQEQPLRILTFLLERPGEVVTRDELRRTLWPAGTFVDFDDGLNAAIKKLRFALGDPRRIRGSSRRSRAAATASSRRWWSRPPSGRRRPLRSRRRRGVARTV